MYYDSFSCIVFYYGKYFADVLSGSQYYQLGAGCGICLCDQQKVCV